MKIRPLNEKILVKVASNEEITAAGIIIPDSAGQERKYEGTVVAVGTHPDIAKNGVAVGNYVIYPKGLNTPITIKENGIDVEYDIVSIYDVQASGTEE